MGAEPLSEAPTLLVRFQAGPIPSNLRAAHGVQLSVPQTLGRKGLRNLIHHLLDLRDGPDFHFLVGEDPLRTTLDKFLLRRNLTAEKTLELTYYLPLPAPTPSPPQKVSEAWLAAVDATTAAPFRQPLVLVGAYSGTPSLHCGTEEILGEDVLREFQHSAAVKAVSWLPGASSFLTASHDQTARLWSFDVEEKAARSVAEFRSEEASTPVSFECVTVAKVTGGERVAAALGAADGSVWVMPDLLANEEEVEQASVGVKRKAPSLRRMMATKVGVTSTDLCVSGVKWKGAVLVSGGWDALVREWDVEKCVANVSIPCGGKAVTSVLVDERVVLVSAVDGGVRLIDARDGKGVIAACGRRGAHRGIAADATWVRRGESAVSAGLDGSLRVWDLRSMLSPAHVVESVHGIGGKCLAVSVAKCGEKLNIYSVGSDGQIGTQTI